MRHLFVSLITLSISMTGLSVPAQELVDLDAINKIRDEGFHRSQVMETAWYITERIGPRVTGSPQLKEANEWTRDQLEEWGLDAWLEGYDFGHGWTLSRCQVHMVAPMMKPLLALPKAWTPATDGPVQGPVVRADLGSEADLEKQKGKLVGAIVLLADLHEPDLEKTMFSRLEGDELADLEQLEIPHERSDPWRKRMQEEIAFWPKLAEFMVAEGIVAVVEPSDWDHGVIRVGRGGTMGMDGWPAGVPALVMATEHYNRILRLVEREVAVELEIEVEASFHHDDKQAHNTISELAGSDLTDQVVMAGAHLDSWHTGTGATDNGGSCAVMMEAVRIIKATGLKPRRTIRVALWSGEEQGFRGSRAYVERHFATRPELTEEELLNLNRVPTWPITPLPDHAKLSAYFNMDHGAGRIRGIYIQENVAVKPIFEAWFEPLHDIGATTICSEISGGTDHQPFNWVGLPGFVFMQDPLEYATRNHHSNLDTYDHLIRDDLVQASVVVATFLWQAANRDELLPRKPMPQEPKEPNSSH
jgi:hypothetical protein